MWLLLRLFVTRPMRRLGQLALRIAGGDGVRMPAKGGDEMSELGRALNGMAAALSLIPLETLVNHRSPTEQRSQYFGCYAFCIALGMALGNLVAFQLRASAPHLAFLLGGASALVGAGFA